MRPFLRHRRKAVLSLGAAIVSFASVLGTAPAFGAVTPGTTFESQQSAVIAADSRAVAELAAAAPTMSVSTVVSGLTIPWDLFFTPDGTMIYNERDGHLWARRSNGEIIPVAADFSDLYVFGEAGLLGMVPHPDFAANRFFYTCQDFSAGGVSDVRVIRWRLSTDLTRAVRERLILTGIPQTAGTHSGCRLRFDRDQLLYISTGDSRLGTAPQDLASLNGKVLRVTATGGPAPGNPYAGSANPNTRLIYTRGHRNPQGLDLRPGTNDMWSVEQGTSRDDEVNQLVPGGNYGWNPLPVIPNSTLSDETSPMTNPNVPGALPAVYSTGSPTLALSGGAWLSGTQWGPWNGTFVAVALKAQTARVLSIVGPRSLAKLETFAALDGSHGRLRSPIQGPDGNLYVTTSNGRNDEILKVTPTNPGPGDGRCYGSQINPTSPPAAVTTGSTVTGYAIGTSGALFERPVTASGVFTNLGGTANFGPAAVSWDGARTDVFVVGTDDQLYHRFRVRQAWSPWEALGGGLTSSPAAISFASGTLDVFARGRDGALWALRWTGFEWSPWTSLGGLLMGGPGAAIDRDTGRARVGVRGLNGELYESTMTPGGSTSGFIPTGIPICSAPSYRTGTGDGELFSWASTDANGSTSTVTGSAVTQLGGTLLGSPAVTGFERTGYAVFGRGTDNALWIYDARTGPGSWRSLGGRLR